MNAPFTIHCLTPRVGRGLIPFTIHCLTPVLAVWLMAARPAGAQETLAYAKNLYIAAAYDEALVLLGRLHETASAPESSEIAGYRAFCLLALGRTEDAKKAIATLVRSDPHYRPPDATMSPRTRAVFDEVRQEMLPVLVHEAYDRGKAAFDRNEPAAAAADFDRVLSLLNEPALANLPDGADLRRLATGFRDLGKGATAAPKPVPDITPLPAPPPPPAPAAPAVFSAGDEDVVPPVSVSRATPPWHPQTDIEKLREFRGLLEVVVDERGNVVSVGLVKSVHPKYDGRLVEAARAWKFRPATRKGTPVSYRAAIEIRLGPGGTQ
jgi:TonB family protein